MMRKRLSDNKSIPAWAGKPVLAASLHPPVSVHPRVGGETAAGIRQGPGFTVHPRVGGETSARKRSIRWRSGPSPRGRGNHIERCDRNFDSRSIPAWAGKPSLPGPPSGCLRVHPRVGGETMRADHTATNLQGPSPRGRGNLGDDPVRRVGTGSIPAWAGKPSTYRVNGSKDTVHPRVGGETSGVIMKALFWTGPSPRGRGNLTREADVVQVERSIPAWAGKPAAVPPVVNAMTVHPRVGGETTAPRLILGWIQGPSPRGRGNLNEPACGLAGQRSIPAWAGKPAGRAPSSAPSRVHPRVGGETLW